MFQDIEPTSVDMVDAGNVDISDYVSASEVEAEKVVLAALMASPQHRVSLRGRVTTEMFGLARHQAIHAAITDADQRGEIRSDRVAQAAVPAVQSALERAHRHVPEEVGRELLRVAECAPYSAGDFTAAVETVEAGRARRVMASTGHRFVRAAKQAAGRSTAELREIAVSLTEDLHAATMGSADDEDSAVVSGWEDFVAGLSGRADRIRLGLIDLDEIVRVRPGHVVLLGARASVGKTALGLTLARRAAELGAYSKYLLFEMSRDEARERVASAVTGVPYERIVSDEPLTEQEEQQLQAASQRIPSNLYLPSSPRRELDSVVAEIYRTAAAAHASGRHPLLFLDYLQQIQVPGSKQPRYELVTEISGAIQHAAQESGCAVVCCAQLSRAATTREDQRPQVADLKESGALEQDAHTVILLYRPDASEDHDGSRAGEIDLIVGKNRSGRTKTVPVSHDLEHQRVLNMARD